MRVRRSCSVTAWPEYPPTTSDASSCLTLGLRAEPERRMVVVPLRLPSKWGGYYGGSFGSLFRFPR